MSTDDLREQRDTHSEYLDLFWEYEEASDEVLQEYLRLFPKTIFLLQSPPAWGLDEFEKKAVEETRRQMDEIETVLWFRQSWRNRFQTIGEKETGQKNSFPEHGVWLFVLKSKYDFVILKKHSQQGGGLTFYVKYFDRRIDTINPLQLQKELEREIEHESSISREITQRFGFLLKHHRLLLRGSISEDAAKKGYISYSYNVRKKTGPVNHEAFSELSFKEQAKIIFGNDSFQEHCERYRWLRIEKESVIDYLRKRVKSLRGEIEKTFISESQNVSLKMKLEHQKEEHEKLKDDVIPIAPLLFSEMPEIKQCQMIVMKYLREHYGGMKITANRLYYLKKEIKQEARDFLLINLGNKPNAGDICDNVFKKQRVKNRVENTYRIGNNSEENN